MEIVSILAAKEAGSPQEQVAKANVYADEILRVRRERRAQLQAEKQRRERISQAEYAVKELQSRLDDLTEAKVQREQHLIELRSQIEREGQRLEGVARKSYVDRAAKSVQAIENDIAKVEEQIVAVQADAEIAQKELGQLGAPVVAQG
jgi:predicted  nucleic acid-binding Zn-ribbon protein